LKQKQVLSKQFERRRESRDYLESILGRIKDAETEAQVLDAVGSGTEVLKQGLGMLKDAQDTVDEMQFVMDEFNDSLPQLATETFDDEELEKELEMILQFEALNMEEPAAKLPEVEKPSEKLPEIEESDVKLPKTEESTAKLPETENNDDIKVENKMLAT
jgi:hypothetical protein